MSFGGRIWTKARLRRGGPGMWILTRNAPQYFPSLIISPTRLTRSKTRRHDWRVSMAESRFSATRRCFNRDFFCKGDKRQVSERPGRHSTFLSARKDTIERRRGKEETYLLHQRSPDLSHLRVQLPYPMTKMNCSLSNCKKRRYRRDKVLEEAKKNEDQMESSSSPRAHTSFPSLPDSLRH